MTTGCRTAVRRVRTAQELYDASGDDAFVRAEWDPATGSPGWACDGAVAFLRGGGHRSLAGVGDPAAAASLVAVVAKQLQAAGTPARAVTVPREGLAYVRADLRLVDTDDWDWMCATTPPQPPELPADMAGDAWSAAWLDADGGNDAELRGFLHASSPTHSAEPGSSWVLRWAAIRDAGGALAATAAHCENVRGIPHLASIATRPDLRGRGLGAAMTAWITRELLHEAPVVTLGLYADNDPARRMYRRLGYGDEHLFSSGRVADGGPVGPPPADCCGVVDCPHG